MAKIRFGPLAKGSSPLSTTASPVQPQAQAPPNQPQVQAQQAQQQQTQQPQQGTVDAQGFSDTDTRSFHQLTGGQKYYQQQQFNIDTRTVLPDYLDPNPVPGSMYNASQNMNWNVVHGNMDPQQQYMYDSLVDGMHNLGQNLTLTRYDHGGALDQMLSDVTGGTVTNHTGLSVQQLRAALVGGTYSDQRILSTSYNDFKNAADPTTFNTREIKITYRAKASTQALMPGVGSIPMRGSGMQRGDDFGEMLLGPTGNGHNTYRVVDVKYSGNGARPKGGLKSNLSLRQIEVVVEVD